MNWTQIFAHGNEIAEIVEEQTGSIEGDIGSLSLKFALYGGLAIILFSAIAALSKKKYPKLNNTLFFSIIIATVLPTTYITGSTIYLNTISDSGGPVHWHADIEYWACGNELELVDPSGLSNKTGNSTLHEHDDRRIHVEGVVIDEKVDPSLQNLLAAQNVLLGTDRLTIPVEPSHVFENDIDGDVPNTENQDQVMQYITTADHGQELAVSNGDLCGTEEAELQVFVYHYVDSENYYQEKLTDPLTYVIADESVVPPGDCVIVEFDVSKDRTDKLCSQYGVIDAERCEAFGVPADKVAGICKLHEQHDEDGHDADTETETLPVDPDAITDDHPHDQAETIDDDHHEEEAL